MKNDSLKLSAYNELKHRIVSCSYAPSSQINEEFLQTELKMSRTPIRDAVSRLEQEGLVSIIPKKGIIVAPLSISELTRTYELRELLECYVLTTYGNRLNESDLLEFYRFYCGFPQDIEHLDHEQYYEKDSALHNMFIEAADNQYISRSYGQLMAQNDRFRFLTGSMTDQRLEQTQKEHVDILAACVKQDWSLASKMLCIHLDHAKDAALNLLLKTELFN